MLPRTIDKLRATLPGGNIGPYAIRGFSQRMLDAIGVSEDELRQAVAGAQNDEEVGEWLRAHANLAAYADISTFLRKRSLSDIEDRAAFAKRYPVIEKKPELHYLFDVLEADDAEMYPR